MLFFYQVSLGIVQRMQMAMVQSVAIQVTGKSSFQLETDKWSTLLQHKVHGSMSEYAVLEKEKVIYSRFKSDVTLALKSLAEKENLSRLLSCKQD